MHTVADTTSRTNETTTYGCVLGVAAERPGLWCARGAAEGTVASGTLARGALGGRRCANTTHQADSRIKTLTMTTHIVLGLPSYSTSGQAQETR